MTEHLPEIPATEPLSATPGHVEVLEEPRKQTGQEIANSLTGFEEIAIKQAFGVSLDQLDAMQVTRSLVFTLRSRGGESSRDAYLAAMQMPQSEVETYFATDDQPDDDRDPFAGDTSPAGKGSPLSAS